MCLNCKTTMRFALFSTILLVQLKVALSYGLEPRENGTVCPERHRCNRSVAAHVRRYCNCDSLCEEYDDCCDDYSRRPRSSNRSAVHRLHRVTSCKHLKFTEEPQFHYVVDRCPKEFGKKVIERNCRGRNSSAEEENTLTRVPVVGRQSMILYRNVYCAICNGEQDVVFSKGRVEYSRQPAMTLDEMTFLPPEGYNLRTCINAIRTCHPNYRDRKVKKRCTGTSQSNSYVNSGKGTYLSYVKRMIWEPPYYRNADCAKCNFVNESKQMCSYAPDEVRHYVSDIPAFTNLIDFTKNTVETVANFGNQRRSTKVFPCNNGQIYDPIKQKCRKVFFPQESRRHPRETFE